MNRFTKKKERKKEKKKKGKKRREAVTIAADFAEGREGDSCSHNSTTYPLGGKLSYLLVIYIEQYKCNCNFKRFMAISESLHH